MKTSNIKQNQQQQKVEDALESITSILFAESDEYHSFGNAEFGEPPILTEKNNTNEHSEQGDIAEQLHQIEPNSGDHIRSIQEAPVAQDKNQNSHSFHNTEDEQETSENESNVMGPLEATLLEYLGQTNNYLNPIQHNIIAAHIDNNEKAASNLRRLERPVEQKNDTTEPEVIEPIAESVIKPVIEQLQIPTESLTIRLSNATHNGDEINNNDNHVIIITDFAPYRARLTGQDVDISSVNSDALLITGINRNDWVYANLRSEWNSIKNIEIESDHEAQVMIRNFVHTDISLGGDGQSLVFIRDAKRGNIETGDGDDRINVVAKTNGAGWSNTFEINSNDGADLITLRGDQGHSIFNVDSGDGADRIRINGQYESSTTHMGEGNDRFLNGASDDVIHGNEGRDIIRAGKGNDEIYGGEGSDFINAGTGDDILNGGTGRDVLVGGRGADTFVWNTDDLDNTRDIVRDFRTSQGDRLDISDVLNFNSASDDLIADFVRLASAGRKNATLEVRADGEGDWHAVATIIRGAKLESVETLVDDGALII